MTDRTKTTVLVLIFAQQLRVWLKYARDFKHVTGPFKYTSGILLSALDRFIKGFAFSGHEEEDDVVYEHSCNLSDLVEKLVQMDETDIKRVEGLIDKLNKEKECHA